MTVPDFQGESVGYNMHFGRPGNLMVSVRALQVLAGDMALLCSWTRHLTLTVTVSLSTRVYLGEGVEIPLVTCHRVF